MRDVGGDNAGGDVNKNNKTFSANNSKITVRLALVVQIALSGAIGGAAVTLGALDAIGAIDVGAVLFGR